MKRQKTKTAFRTGLVMLLLISLISFIGCSEDNNPITGPNGSNNNGNQSATQNPMTAHAITQFQKSVQASGSDESLLFDNHDAYLSLSWTPGYGMDGAGDRVGDAFGMAINYKDPEEGLNQFGLDMGDLAVHYGNESVPLTKSEDDFFIFYGLWAPIVVDFGFINMEDLGNPSLTIPYLPFEDYSFVATGSDEFPAYDIAVDLPGSNVEISSPESDFIYVAGNSLEVTWPAGNSGESFVVSLFPIIEFSEEDFLDFDPSIWDAGFEVVDASAGRFVFSASRMETLLSWGNSEQLYVELYATTVSVNEIDGKNIAIDTHVGDAVLIGIETQ